LKKTLKEIAVTLLAIMLLILFLPVIIGYLLFKLVMTPVDYAKYKRSRYQQDFPRKYKWLMEPHIDNIPYTLVKESDLPIEYIKRKDEYDLPGYFIFKDALLNFSCPFFFDSQKRLLLCYPEDAGKAGSLGDDIDSDNTDDCLTLDEASSLFLDQLRENTSGRVCRKVVFFYEKTAVEENYEKGALEAMLLTDNFIIYEKDKLAEALEEFVRRESISSDTILCPYLGNNIDRGMCYDMQMIAHNAIKPEALPEINIDRERLSSLCDGCEGKI